MDKINDIKIRIVPILRKAGVSRSFVFGSYARKESRKDSDLDIIVEFSKKKSLLDLVALKLELEKKTGIEIDVLTSGSIHPNINNLIQKEKIQIL